MLITTNPTANETPDSGQGGSAVTGNSNTGHAATTSSAADGSDETKTCRWSAFTSPGGLITAVTLKVDWSEDGVLSGVGASNVFELAYSTNNGGSWTNFFSHTGITSGSSGTASVALSALQDLAQVQVRDRLRADTNDPGETANVTGTVSAVRLEIETTFPQGIVVM